MGAWVKMRAPLPVLRASLGEQSFASMAFSICPACSHGLLPVKHGARAGPRAHGRRGDEVAAKQDVAAVVDYRRRQSPWPKPQVRW